MPNELHTAAAGDGSQRFEQCLHDGIQAHRPRRDLELARRRPRDVEQVFDEPRK
jgi:hypothetical protein